MLMIHQPNSVISLASLKQLGMDRVVSLLRPDRKALFILYPNAQSYVNLPFTKAEIASELMKLSPDTVRGYQMLSAAGSKTNHLDEKTRQLISLAVAVTTHCDGCIVVHTDAR